MPKRVTTLRIEEELRAELRRHAEERGISEAELIRQAIVFYLGWLHGQSSQSSSRSRPSGPE